MYRFFSPFPHQEFEKWLYRVVGDLKAESAPAFWAVSLSDHSVLLSVPEILYYIGMLTDVSFW